MWSDCITVKYDELLLNTMRKHCRAICISPIDNYSPCKQHWEYFSFGIFERIACNLMKYVRVREYMLTKLEIIYGLKKKNLLCTVEEEPYFFPLNISSL